MKRSCHELSIGIIMQKGIFKINQITLSLCFTSLPKSGGTFYCVELCFLRYYVRKPYRCHIRN